MADTAVAWAEKMADVLGERVKNALLGDSPSPGGKNGAPNGTAAPADNGAPSGSADLSGNGTPSGKGTPTSGGTPTGGNAAPAKGGAPTAATPNGAGAPPAGAPAANGKGDAPAAGAPKADASIKATEAPAAAPAGSSAKAQAEAAKKALASVNAIATKATAADAELKKFAADAQAAKKQVDGARSQAEAAEKSIPAPARVPKPQGKDPQAQYDSAIQIKGGVLKVEMDAQGKIDVVREQAGVAAEAGAKIGVAQQGAAKSAGALKLLADEAASAADAATSAASAAASAAAESKKKADQAVKDKSADKDSLQQAAQDDAKHAAAAKEAAAKAQAAAKQLAAQAKTAGAQSQAAEKLKQDAESAEDALKKKETALFERLNPHFDAVGDASQQEAEYKAKLSEADAEWVLQERYEKLGGDKELAKLLADEDKAFVTATETHRAELQQWQLRQIKQLDAYKAKLAQTLKDGEAALPAQKQFLEREAPLAEKAQGDAEALGEKLNTEPGKELSHEIRTRTERIERTAHKIEFNEKLIEKTSTAMEDLSRQYSYIDEQYEASEKLIADSRTGLDNECEMNAMTLENKVYFLQTQPKPVRDRIQKQLNSERDRIVRMNVLEVDSIQIEFQPPSEPPQLDPIDWKSVHDKISKLQAATLEQLKQNDPKLAEIQAEYEKAGGDPALLAKRVAQWKRDVADALQSDKKRGDEYAAREEKLRQHHDEAESRRQLSEANYKGTSNRLEQQRKRLKELEKKKTELKPGESLSRQEQAELCLIDGEIKQLAIEESNYYRQSVADKFAQSNAASLLESERVRHEQVVDDDRHYLPQPTSEDIHKMPLRAKYTELTGKSLPA